jgi:hypothetical protein
MNVDIQSNPRPNDIDLITSGLKDFNEGAGYVGYLHDYPKKGISTH